MEKQRLLDAKAAEIRDAAKESSALACLSAGHGDQYPHTELDQLIESLKKRSEEHDNLLKKIAEGTAASQALSCFPWS